MKTDTGEEKRPRQRGFRRNRRPRVATNCRFNCVHLWWFWPPVRSRAPI